MTVGTTQLAVAADEIREALRLNPLAFSKDESAEADMYWRLVRLVATERDSLAVAEAVMVTLREQVQRLITERAVQISMDAAEGEEQKRFDRRYHEAFIGGAA